MKCVFVCVQVRIAFRWQMEIGNWFETYNIALHRYFFFIIIRISAYLFFRFRVQNGKDNSVRFIRAKWWVTMVVADWRAGKTKATKQPEYKKEILPAIAGIGDTAVIYVA